MTRGSLDRDSVNLRSVAPLLLRRGARFLFEHVLIAALRPIARLGSFGKDAAAPTARTTSWVLRRPLGGGTER